MSGECNLCGGWGHTEGSCPYATEEERKRWSITKDGFTRLSGSCRQEDVDSFLSALDEMKKKYREKPEDPRLRGDEARKCREGE